MAVKFNLAKLNGRVVEKFGTRAAFAEAAGISAGKLYPRLQGVVPFGCDEVAHIIRPELLDIPPEEIADYFFNVEFDKSN